MLALIDERYDRDQGRYLLSAVLIDLSLESDTRVATSEVPRKIKKGPFHWWRELDRNRARMIEHIAALDCSALVVISARVRPNRQERARRICLSRMLFELAGLGATLLYIERRQAAQDRRDVELVRQLRRCGIIDPRLRFEFRNKSEPLLWLADAICGAAGHHDDTFAAMLGTRLRVVEVDGPDT